MLEELVFTAALDVIVLDAPENVVFGSRVDVIFAEVGRAIEDELVRVAEDVNVELRSVDVLLTPDEVAVGSTVATEVIFVGTAVGLVVFAHTTLMLGAAAWNWIAAFWKT